MRLITRTSFIFIRKFIYVKFNYKGGEFSKFAAWSFAKIKRIYIGVIKKAAFALINAAILVASKRNRAAKRLPKRQCRKPHGPGIRVSLRQRSKNKPPSRILRPAIWKRGRLLKSGNHTRKRRKYQNSQKPYLKACDSGRGGFGYLNLGSLYKKDAKAIL